MIVPEREISKLNVLETYTKSEILPRQRRLYWKNKSQSNSTLMRWVILKGQADKTEEWPLKKNHMMSMDTKHHVWWNKIFILGHHLFFFLQTLLSENWTQSTR